MRGSRKTAKLPFGEKQATNPEREGTDWHIRGELFPPIAGDCQKALDMLPVVLEAVWPLSKKHRESLPDDIQALSQILTRRRGDLDRSYWSAPAFISAYLYYFLPWNLVRLCRLLPGLPLPEPCGLSGAKPALLDCGSGPLTLPLALWLSRPAWRDSQLNVLALDTSPKPVALGASLLAKYAETLGTSAWRVSAAGGSIETLAGKYETFRARHGEKAYPWLVSCVNVINELKPFGNKRGAGHGQDGITHYPGLAPQAKDGQSGSVMTEKISALLTAWRPLWRTDSKGPLALFVEPGTRLGGTTIMEIRKVALMAGFHPLSPCPHPNPCPLLKYGGTNSGYAKSWCHFTFSALKAPAWLLSLSAQAGLGKQSLSISPLLLAPGRAKNHDPQGGMAVRVLSGSFKIPGMSGAARYGCSARGLCLLANAPVPQAGDLTMAKIPEKPQVDKKSGAIIIKPQGVYNKQLNQNGRN